jgi:hypothetical protein
MYLHISPRTQDKKVFTYVQYVLSTKFPKHWTEEIKIQKFQIRALRLVYTIKVSVITVGILQHR